MSIAVINGASSGLGACYVDAVTKVFPEIEELWLIARREDRLKEVASKSYVSAFCLGLREELKHRRINVCAMCPGLMLTEMNQHNGKAELTKGQKRLPVIDPKVAAVKSLKAAKNGRAVYTTGAFYKCYRLLAKLVPHTLLVKFASLG